MEGPPLGPRGEDITWPEQVAPGGLKASSTRSLKPQTSNHNQCRRLSLPVPACSHGSWLGERSSPYTCSRGSLLGYALGIGFW